MSDVAFYNMQCLEFGKLDLIQGISSADSLWP